MNKEVLMGIRSARWRLITSGLWAVVLIALVACSPVAAPGAESVPDSQVSPLLGNEPVPTSPVPLPTAADTVTSTVTGTITDTMTDTMTDTAEMTATATVPAPELGEGTMDSRSAATDIVTLAKEDLAERLALPVDEIEVLEARAVTWPDTSLGCPQPDQIYAQVLQEGWLIRLRAGGEMYFYHSGPSRPPFLCEQLSDIMATDTPRGDELRPPPRSEVD